MKFGGLAMFSVLVPIATLGCGGGGSKDGLLASATTPGTFSAANSTAYARSSHGAVSLANGKVLVVGGITSAPTAELYDASTGSFALASGSMAAPNRESLTATLLGTGKVLIAGGLGTSPLSSAELFDPTTGTFSNTGSMSTARYGHTATLLSNGKVLIAGGQDSGAEIYDPSAGTFSPTASMSTVRSYHTATRLANGKVLITGGQLESGSAISTAEIYDLSTGTFASTNSMNKARRAHRATLLANGSVLITGGGAEDSGANITSSAEIYNPATGTFFLAVSMTRARESHTATLLSSGRVLIAGGYQGGGVSGYLASAEVYDPSSGAFIATSGSLVQARDEHTATLLSNGKVLIVGGGNYTSSLSSCELYQ